MWSCPTRVGSAAHNLRQLPCEQCCAIINWRTACEVDQLSLENSCGSSRYICACQLPARSHSEHCSAAFDRKLGGLLGIVEEIVPSTLWLIEKKGNRIRAPSSGWVAEVRSGSSPAFIRGLKAGFRCSGLWPELPVRHSRPLARLQPSNIMSGDEFEGCWLPMGRLASDQFPCSRSRTAERGLAV